MTYNEAVSVLTELYYKHMGRAPDSAGLDWWANALVSGQATPEHVADEFSKTPEATYFTMYLQSVVEEIYWSELGRDADAGGLQFWMDALRNPARSAEQVRSEIHSSSEAITYRANLPVIPQPDPRVSAMRDFDLQGNATVPYRRGDSLKQLALQAYGTTDLWWVIGQANNAMTDRELYNSSNVIVPDLRPTSASRNAIQVDDNGQAIIYANKITGDQWPEYYIPLVSQLDPIDYEDNPNWLAGLAFVNGNDAWNNPFYQFARPQPYTLMPPSFWLSSKNSVDIPIEDVAVPLNIDTSTLAQLPVFSSGDSAPNGPPPAVTYTSGADPTLANKLLAKYPDQILNTVRISGVKVVAVKKSVVEYFPQLHGVPIPNWGGKTWDESPGAFSERWKVVTVATDPDAKKSGSLNLFGHEFAHAYDWAMGTLSLSPSFEAAFKADFTALQNASPGYEYFTKRDATSTSSNPTYVRAQRESYAESFANYYAGNARWFADKPALMKYFKALPRPVQPK